MPLKIYFCDACNESIPLKDLHSNRITFDAGKIFCSDCAPKRPRDAVRFGAGVVAGAVGFAALALVAYLGGREIQRAAGETAQVASTAERLDRELNRMRGDAFTRAECERMLAPVADAEARARQDLKAAGDRLRAVEETQRTTLVELERKLGEAGKQIAELRQELGQARRVVEADLTDAVQLKAAVADLKTKLEDVDARLKAVGEARPAAVPAPAADAGKPASPEEAEVARWKAMLREPDAGRRYEAVNGLANLHADGAVEALEGALGDAESYVRDAAVRALRRHASLKSVPKIIGALRDSDLFVRTSAKAALKQLVGVEPNFDPDADPARRERGVKDFEGWWNTNSEKFLGPK
jgi:hypothetical protein